ncbi:hypothetical protein FHS43_005352 [Streptosporangium becharense]|uniref:Uncharacterized protein n=1 Tax=Streptosporangium becharense TaxID=1816182 RepID=A0A7W9IAC2_9ACTN|nr:hypothetical protein [Streptosporangium becharense]MBB2914040.1 hypothetical protein [Streptosporangium becharense]MBB5817067.1 hypothetical protein [Streptosporangium becharense]
MTSALPSLVTSRIETASPKLSPAEYYGDPRSVRVLAHRTTPSPVSGWRA